LKENCGGVLHNASFSLIKRRQNRNTYKVSTGGWGRMYKAEATKKKSNF